MSALLVKLGAADHATKVTFYSTNLTLWSAFYSLVHNGSNKFAYKRGPDFMPS